MTVERTIIVVEDEQDAAEMFGEMMRVSGYHVLTAYGSEAAMAMIAKQRPDAVILDIMMPEISGLAVLEFMHNDPKLSNIPVVVVSAQGTPADIQTCLDAGAVAYLIKPIGFIELKEVVEKALGAPR
jgi:CheY-like chemotaxis protein